MSSKPAVLLITADQLRRDALGCYGNEAVATPHLDRLAATGTVFDCAYTASPWCLPSRSALLTGRYPHNHGAYSNFRDTRLSADVPNLYQEFGNSGYSVSHIGKCHYAPVPYGETRPDQTLPYESFRDYYLSLGIEHLALQDDKQVSVWFYDDYARELDQAGHLEAYRAAVWDRSARKVFPFPGPAQWHPDSWVGRKTSEWINDYDDARPSFVWASFSGPHFPFDAPAEYLSRVDESKLGEPHVVESEWDDPARLHYYSFHGPAEGHMEGGGFHDRDAAFWRQLRLNYHANVALIDDQIGQIIEAAEAKFGDDLAIVFTCDHGEMLGNHGFWGKNRCFYEDVLRVPLIVRQPGKKGANTRSDRLTSLVDVYPTLSDLAGLDATDGIDGRHLDEEGHDYVLAEGERFFTVTDGRHKLVTAHVDGTSYTEMFDLEADPHEVDNVAGKPDHASAQRDLQEAALNALLNAALP